MYQVDRYVTQREINQEYTCVDLVDAVLHLGVESPKTAILTCSL